MEKIYFENAPDKLHENVSVILMHLKRFGWWAYC
jgi:hypothetical protein